MIKTVKISNFKSVQDLEIELGRLNVFIGENGCGKTSILEGIAMGEAALQGKSDSEFISSRGVRMTNVRLMKSAFKISNAQMPIKIGFYEENAGSYSVEFESSNNPQEYWRTSTLVLSESTKSSFGNNEVVDNERLVRHFTDKVAQLLAADNRHASISDERIREIAEEASRKVLASFPKEQANRTNEEYETVRYRINFLLFAPENYFLRRFEEEGQIRPLGIRGEGLFRHLVELSKEAPETFAAIAENLSLIDWYGGFAIPNDLQFTERRIAITDRFIADTIKDFDQRSANEGFLYLLFYFTLFLSKWTPKFFAIDNVDNALNPRLCTKLVEVLAKLSKEQNKQAILTTHNPAILDGLDLNDDEQRLFVIYRNADGATQARRVKPLQALPGVEPVRLSEAFVRGYLGGLPQNF